jgi:hypothetical protein
VPTTDTTGTVIPKARPTMACAASWIAVENSSSAGQSANIKSCAIRNGWRPYGATALEALARKIWALKSKPSLAGIYNADERYQRWKDGQ